VVKYAYLAFLLLFLIYLARMVAKDLKA
jgi:hypothetical protein